MKLLQKIAIVVTVFFFGVLICGTTIAMENEGVISDALGAETYKIVTKEGAEDEDTIYYKSDYEKVGDLIKAAAKVNEDVMAEGAVLLMNNNNALPLKKGDKISLLGVNSANPVYGGTGSGSVDTSKAISFEKGFTDAGFEVNPDFVANYKPSTGGQSGAPVVPGGPWGANEYQRSSVGFTGGTHKVGEVPWSVISSTAGVNEQFAAYGDAAIYIIGRKGGEGADLQKRNVPDGYNGDQLHFNQNEMDTLRGLKALKDAGKIKKVIVIINYASSMACDCIKDPQYGVDAALWVGCLGQNGGAAVGKIIAGDVNPSGSLPDTFWYVNEANPVLTNFGYWQYTNHADYVNDAGGKGTYYANEKSLSGYMVYQEGMYLGYRYTETRYEDKVLGTSHVGDFDYNKVVGFPFGYGLSYTNFEYSNFNVSKDGKNYTVSVDVKNTGNVAGKEAVQIYVSKPYNDYCRTNKIQVPSIDLVDFGKTSLLEPGKSETVKVTVNEKYFASYDAWNAKTYVITGGDYYLTAASDSHAAINNILLAKKNNGVNVDESKMVNLVSPLGDGKGNASMVAKYSLGYDKVSYSISDATGKGITNLFDHGDINRYEHRGNNKVDYYNRDKWDEVSFDWDNGVPVLSMTAEMAEQVLQQAPADYDKPIPKEAKQKYPTYGKDAGLKLIDMRYNDKGEKIKQDDPAWEVFMDQLTWDEQVHLVATGQHNTVAIDSIAKPLTRDENGPNGFNYAYNGQISYKQGLFYLKERDAGHISADGKKYENADPDGAIKTCAMPANGIIAATMNKDLALKAGEIIGEDGLWCGKSGLYGVGNDNHRTPYLGRCCEYYSECGQLTGIIAAYESKGVESKGVHVYNKHCVLNDLEDCRHGIAVWLPEQALREIYLRAFELPITMGGAFDLMAAFNRIGAINCACDTHLAQDFMRGECGMEGIIVTDMYTDMNGSQGNSSYFNIEYGIYTGGCDIPDGNGHEARFDIYKPDANNEGEYITMANSIRLAAKRVCYHTLWSQAMNDISSNTEIVTFTPWWVILLTCLDIGFGVLMLGAIAWPIVTLLLKKKA